MGVHSKQYDDTKIFPTLKSDVMSRAVDLTDFSLTVNRQKSLTVNRFL